jgi:2-desacetyl-2-hydroxyethyl bacteriochlorophyllide A dehydrogenase
MRAAIRTAPRRVEVVDVSEPARRDDEALVRVEYVALCGGDLQYFRGPMPFRDAIPGYADRPYIVCHEAVGTVVEASPGGHVRPGDRVTIDPQHRCEHCAFCLSGSIELCPERRDMGYSADGAAADLVSVPAHRVFPVPAAASSRAAAATHGLAAVLHALTSVSLDRVERALVTGPGPAGLMFSMSLRAKLANAEIALLGRASPRLDIAASLGITPLPLERTTFDTLRYEWGRGSGYDLIVETTGAADIVEQALWCARPKGTLLLYAPTTFRLDGNVVFRRELRLVGSTGATGGMEPALELIADSRVPLERILTHDFDLSEIQDAFELATAPPEERGGLLKAVVRVT